MTGRDGKKKPWRPTDDDLLIHLGTTTIFVEGAFFSIPTPTATNFSLLLSSGEISVCYGHDKNKNSSESGKQRQNVPRIEDCNKMKGHL